MLRDENALLDTPIISLKIHGPLVERAGGKSEKGGGHGAVGGREMLRHGVSNLHQPTYSLADGNFAKRPKQTPGVSSLCSY